MNASVVSLHPVLLLLLEPIYALCLRSSFTTAINSKLHLLGSYCVPETMLNILNVFFKPHNCTRCYFSCFIHEEPEALKRLSKVSQNTKRESKKAGLQTICGTLEATLRTLDHKCSLLISLLGIPGWWLTYASKLLDQIITPVIHMSGPKPRYPR